tara:strand:- start:6340 stop:8310 length:1971 start_codon:yes stop_codon:yes gene_type:complete
MILNSKNLKGSDSSGSTNNNLELGRIGEATLREATPVLPSAPAHSSLDEEWKREQKSYSEETRNRLKRLSRCWAFWIVLLIFGLGSLALFASINSRRIEQIESNDDDSESKVVSSGNTLRFYVHDNKLYSSVSVVPLLDLSEFKGGKGDTGATGPAGVNGTNGINGINGINGSTPILDVRNGVLYSDNKELISIRSIINSEIAANHALIEDDKLSEYDMLDHAPGSTYIGRSYDPVSDTHGSSVLIETFGKGNTFTNPITDIKYKRPDFIANFDQNHESSAVSSTELFESTTEYQKARATEIGVSGGYGGMFKASVSSGQRSAMVSLSKSDTAVAKSILYQKTYEAKAEQNLIPFVKPDFTKAASSLPEFPDRRIVNGMYGNNLRGDVNSPTREEQEIIDKYIEFSMIWGDFFVSSIDLGGSITMFSEISNFANLVGAYSRSIVKASVGGGWGPFSAKAGVSNTITKTNAEREVKSYSKDTIFVTSGSGVGDMDDPSSVVSNLDDWGDTQMQSHMDRSRRSPVVVAEKVLPVYLLMPDGIKEWYKKFLQFKYGSESESLADITAKFNEETAKTKNALKDMKEQLQGQILDIHIPKTSSIKFEGCHWVEWDEMGRGDHASTCPGANEVVKSMHLYHHSGKAFWTYGALCCTISAAIS